MPGNAVKPPGGLGDRLTVGHLPLTQTVQVRILVAQPSSRSPANRCTKELLIFSRQQHKPPEDWQGPHKFLGTKPMYGSSREFLGSGKRNNSWPLRIRNQGLTKCKCRRRKKRRRRSKTAVEETSRSTSLEGFKRERTRHDCGSFPEFKRLQPGPRARNGVFEAGVRVSIDARFQR